MRYCSYILAFLFLGCNAQTNYKIYRFNSIGWTVKVPNDFKIIDSLTLKQMNSDGEKLAQNAYNTEARITAPNTLISFKKGESNAFICNTIPFDTTKDGSWNEHVQFLKELAFKTLQTSTQNIENVQIDTSSSVELIDKNLFDKFNLRIVVPNRKDVNMNLFSTLRNGYDVGITIVYQDEIIKKRFYNILMKSTFN
jgi:uncharacterized lipoprotein YehR (DUF1307 family)